MGRKRLYNSDRPQAMPAVVEPQPSNESIQLPGRLDSRPEIPLPGLTSFSLDGVGMPREKSPAAPEEVNKALGHKKKPPTHPKKKSKYYNGAPVRRSARIKSTVVSPPNTNCSFEVIEDITLSESEKDEAVTEHVMANEELELPQVPESEPESEPELADNLGEKKSFDEKVDRALRRIDALDDIVELLKDKVDEHLDLYESPSISYRSMYIDSQKKIEELTFENQRLNAKLENALGKIEVYEKEMRAKDAVKDTMISNMAKTLEAVVNVSTQAIHKECSASAVKRKRSEN
ncbi:hypothetical protein VNO78_17320 [Psophocarpus tetragonolobus]|uniref:Uncharacterized protein n=1 Tax=Psophocarpus tetragonolobus TaxID=3891 RepID=A0AAN9SMN0_PSOTE